VDGIKIQGISEDKLSAWADGEYGDMTRNHEHENNNVLCPYCSII
jgi:hypothetical protein